MDQKHPSVDQKHQNHFPVDRNYQNIPNGLKASNIPQWTKNHHKYSSVSQDHQLNPK